MNIFHQDHQIKIMPSQLREIKFPEKSNQDRVAFSDKKLFIVNGLNNNKKEGVYITVVSLDNGEKIKEFLAVSLDHLEVKPVSLCERMRVDGDVLLLTISQGKDRKILMIII